MNTDTCPVPDPGAGTLNVLAPDAAPLDDDRARRRLRGALLVDWADLDVARDVGRAAAGAGVRVCEREAVRCPPLSARSAGKRGRLRRGRRSVVDVDPRDCRSRGSLPRRWPGTTACGRRPSNPVVLNDASRPRLTGHGTVNVKSHELSLACSTSVDRERDALDADSRRTRQTRRPVCPSPSRSSTRARRDGRDRRHDPVAQRDACAVERGAGARIVLCRVAAARGRAAGAVGASDAELERRAVVDADRDVGAAVGPDV